MSSHATPDPRPAAELVPHRPPVLFIDDVLASSPERVSVAREVLASEWWLEEGPAGEREVAFGGLLEGMAQSAAVLCGAAHAHLEQPPPLGLLVGIRDLVIDRPLREGERVTFAAEVVRSLPPLVLVACTAHVGEERIAAGELKFFVPEPA